MVARLLVKLLHGDNKKRYTILDVVLMKGTIIRKLLIEKTIGVVHMCAKELTMLVR